MVLRTIAKHSYDSTLFYIRSNYSGLTPVYAPEASTAGLLDLAKKLAGEQTGQIICTPPPRDVVPSV